MPAVLLSSCVFLSTWAIGFSQPHLRENWPGCVSEDKVPESAAPITADVREFIKHPDHVRHRVLVYNSDKPLGMALRERPHDNGEMVDEVQAGSQAWAAGVQRGWIITEINGKKLSPEWTLRDVATNVSAAQGAGPTLKVKYDVRAAVDCLHASCNNSDRFPADTARHCAIACERISNCQYWSWNGNGRNLLAQKMCFLHGSASELTEAKGFTTGVRHCVPVPKMSKSTSWPACLISDADLSYGNPVFTDVRPFIVHRDDYRHKDLIFTSEGIGMILREEPHDLGELVSDVVPGSQAAKAGVRSGWIIKEVNGKPFTKKEKLFDVHEDFELEKHRFATLTVKFDVKSHTDCTKGYCGYSEKFPAELTSDCADACFQVPECAVWFFETDEEDTMCWLRSDYAGLRSEVGSVAGSSDCSPAAAWGRFVLMMIVALVITIAIGYAFIRRVFYKHSTGLCFWKSVKLLD